MAAKERNNRKIRIIFVSLLTTSSYILGTLYKQTDLEIYTKDNIYYIKHLTVTNEVDNNRLQFESREELKEYISNLTAKENK